MVKTLVTAIGFQPHLVTKPREAVGASTVIGVATSHPRSQETAKQLQAISEKEDWSLRILTVGGAFNLADWHGAWQEACELAGNDATLNLTAGHGVSTSAAAIIAFQTGLEAIVYDDILDKAHRFTPRQLEFIGGLDAAEKSVLAALERGPYTVGDLAIKCTLQVSHTSRVLSRLKSKGFVRQEIRGRERINHLRPGIAP